MMILREVLVLLGSSANVTMLLILMIATATKTKLAPRGIVLFVFGASLLFGWHIAENLISQMMTGELPFDMSHGLFVILTIIAACSLVAILLSAGAVTIDPPGWPEAVILPLSFLAPLLGGLPNNPPVAVLIFLGASLAGAAATSIIVARALFRIARTAKGTA